MSFELLIILLILAPIVISGLTLLIKSERSVLIINVIATLASILSSIPLIIKSSETPITLFDGLVYIDALSSFNIMILLFVFISSALFSIPFFMEEHKTHHFDIIKLRLFAILFNASLSSMLLVLISNNIGIILVGIESTTLLTAFLIALHREKASIEAMWKYIILCSVGIGLAFMGTIMIAGAASNAGISHSEILHWTKLKESAAFLNQSYVKIGFIFIVVGFGTKAGLAPMHTWLPDAHGQAKAPISAIFSGGMLNIAIYTIMRYIPIVEGATGFSGWYSEILLVIGIASLIISSAFIIYQSDAKRFLAYCSVEHMGIITLALSFKTFGIAPALFHTMNHSISKLLAFISIGRIGQIYKTLSMRHITGAARVSRTWSIAFLASILSLIGMIPFPVFSSKLMILIAGISTRGYIPLSIFLISSTIVFMASLKYALGMVGGAKNENIEPIRISFLEKIIPVVIIIILLTLGIVMPEFCLTFIYNAASVVGG